MMKYFIIALSGLLVACGPKTTSISTTPSVEMAEIEVPAPSAADEIISVARSGNSSGQTLIFIPGLASSADVWSDVITEFQDYDLRLVQVAGFAGAAKFQTEVNYTDLIAGAINSHLLAHPGRNTVLIGHSMGGFVSLKTALKNDQIIEKIVIVDSLPFLAEMFIPGATPQQVAISGPAMAAQMAAMPRAAFDRQQASGVGRLVKTSGYHDTIKNWGKESDQTIVAQVMGELLASDLRDELSALTPEVHVFAAQDKAMGMSVDQIKTLYSSQYKAAPNHKVTVIEDSFHFIMIDQTDAFIAALQTALD